MKRIFPYYHKAVKYIGIENYGNKKADSIHNIITHIYWEI